MSYYSCSTSVCVFVTNISIPLSTIVVQQVCVCVCVSQISPYLELLKLFNKCVCVCDKYLHTLNYYSYSPSVCVFVTDLSIP
jgi:hypothetical protein